MPWQRNNRLRCHNALRHASIYYSRLRDAQFPKPPPTSPSAIFEITGDPLWALVCGDFGLLFPYTPTLWTLASARSFAQTTKSFCDRTPLKGRVTMNWELKIAINRRWRSQTLASKPLAIDEARLSRLFHGHAAPTAEERRRFAAALGCDYFAPDENPVRADDQQQSGEA